jgi:hypothetical protein
MASPLPCIGPFAESLPTAPAAASLAPTTPAPMPASDPRSGSTTKSAAPASTSASPRTSSNGFKGQRRAVVWAVAATVVAVVIGITVVWHPWTPHTDSAVLTNPTTQFAPPPPPSALTPAPQPTHLSAVPLRSSVDGQPVDPASVGPAEGSSCTHAQLNNSTIANSGSIVRCVSGPGGFLWAPDTGEQVDPAIVGQQGWAACLKSFSETQCVRAAVSVAGGVYPAGPVCPPGTYAVPTALPYGTYGSSIDFGTGQFSMGTAANPCTFTTYDSDGKVVASGTFDSYSQPSPSVEIGNEVTSFRTSGCTPWVLTRLH